MKATRLLHIGMALLTLALVGSMLQGCTKKNAVVKVIPIPRADADDIVQTIGTSLSSDNGGWYLLIRTIADSLSNPAPNLTAGLPRGFSLPMAGGPHTRNSFTISGGAGPVVYNVDVAYVQGDSTISSTRDTASTDLVMNVLNTGGPFTNANGIDGTYWMSAADSSILVSYLQPGRVDTLQFSGTFDDSTFALVHSTITPNAGRLWFHKNFVDFTLNIPRANLKTNPYPIASSELRLNIEAFGLNSATHSDWAFDDFVEVVFHFDGTENAIVSIGDFFPEPSWFYTYTMNLKTGAVARH